MPLLKANESLSSVGSSLPGALRHIAAAVAVLCVFTLTAAAQTLNVTYGRKGVQRIAFGGQVLADTGANPGDAFHIWHMKSTDLAGNASGGWGENNIGTGWDAGSHTETYNFTWGSISTQFVQNGNNLDMIVTERNNAGSGVVFDGAEIYPVTLHFPQDPVGFSGYTQYAITTTGPGVSVADYGAGVVTSVIPDETVPMYGGWKTAGGNAYSPLMTTTSPDGLATFLPHLDRPVMPGTSFSYTVSLRFTAAGVAAAANDAYASFAAMYPSQMTWSDHRALGTVYLGSAPASTSSGGFPNNPRHYFNDPSVDVNSAGGLQAFQNRMLAQAAANVANARALNSQGVITWDIEGEQFPHATTYVCSPEQIATVAPEMESIVTDPGSSYRGQRLDDAYFKTMTTAGLKVGVCVRPQVFTLMGDGTAQQIYLGTNAAIVANLEKKVRFANARWGATIFYIDSTVDTLGGTLDPAIFQQLITDLPGFLFIPEESTPRYYAYSAPFYSFIFHGDLGTAAAIYNVYPHAFGANLVNDVDAGKLAAAVPQLTQAVKNGDILMGHVDYWQANDPTIAAIYAAAGTTTPTPVQVTPSISWNGPAAIVYGTPLSGTQLNASASTAGSFVYSPAAGAILNAGNTTLTTTFTPADSTNYTTATASVGLTVQQATPVITWPTPAAIVAGTALGAAQLNATANVAGTFAYNPAAGVVPGVGTTTLNAAFTPADTANYSAAGATTSLIVSAAPLATPAITWATPAPITYGTALSGAQLNATASVAGSFNYVPGAGTVPAAGLQTLVALFTPADTGKYNGASGQVVLNVNRAVPVLTWAPPAAITAGTALSAVQLNAAASVPGTFTYSPGAGSVLPAGLQTLSAVFAPADSGNYAAASASVPLTVNAAPVVVPTPTPTPTPVAVSPLTKLAILTPGDGAVVSGTVVVAGQCLLQLDAAGSHLLLDGVETPGHVTDRPYLFPLDTRAYSNGTHTLQLWAHDIGNNTTVTAAITITVSN